MLFRRPRPEYIPEIIFLEQFADPDIEPSGQDSLGLKITVIGVWLATIGTAAWFGYKAINPDGPPPEAAFLSDVVVDCRELIRFEARTEAEQEVLLGRRVQFEGRLLSHALSQYGEKRVALAAYACAQLRRQVAGGVLGEAYDIHLAFEPVVGHDGTFYINESLTEVGRNDG
jgi:hypothetical protein